MRQVWLIAWHGFYQHATSRAFVFGMLLLPIYMILGGIIPNLSQSQLASLGGPVRHFAVIDKTGTMIQAIDAELDRNLAAARLYALSVYVLENTDAEKLRAIQPKLASLLFDGDPQSPGTIDAIAAMGGVEAAFTALRPALKPDSPAFDAPQRRFIRVDVPPEIVGSPDIAEAARPYLSAEKLIAGPSGAVALWAVLVIPEGFGQNGESAEYYSDDLQRLGTREFLRGALDNELKRRRALALDVPETEVPSIFGAGGFIRTIDPAPETIGTLGQIRQFGAVSAIIVCVMLFLAVFMTANMVVMALVEEKSSRVAELLLSCVRAETLMAGKLFAGLLLALLLIGVWIASAVASIDFLFPTAKALIGHAIGSISTPEKALQLFTFFALSYLTISVFFLAAGSAATSTTDAQAIMAPATMITTPIFFLPLAIASAPDGDLARIASFVPFFSPFAMMVRSTGTPEGIDVLGAFVVSTLTLWWMIRVAARVFRANLLRPDSSTSFTAFLRDLWRGTANSK
jgi:ABC-2 type transport system permease protein